MSRLPLAMAVTISSTWACSGGGSGESQAEAERDAAPIALHRETEPVLPPVQISDAPDAPAVPGPHFTGAAVEAFSAGNWAVARAGFEELRAAEGGSAENRARLQVLIAVCDRQTGQSELAATGFEAALSELPVLADYLHFQAAEMRYRLGDVQAAKRHLDALSAESPYAEPVVFLRGNLLRGRKQLDAAIRHYEQYLGESPKREVRALFRLASLARRRRATLTKALDAYRRIVVGWPGTDWARDAQKELVKLRKRLPRKKRWPYFALSSAERVVRGRARLRAHRQVDAARDFEAALARKKIEPAVACEATYYLGQSFWKRRRRSRSAPLFDDAMTLCGQAGNADLAVKAAFQAGRSYDRMDETAKALERFAWIEANHPTHDYADDARFLRALEQEEAGDIAEMQRLLGSIPQVYPNGDRKGEALWRLALQGMREEEYREALRWLTERKELIPRDTDWRFEGLSDYWLGRAHAGLGHREQALRAYESTARRYPLSYYALLALNRLREQSEERYEKLVADIVAGTTVEEGAAPVEEEKEPAPAAALLALELVQLGLIAEAEEALRGAGRDPSLRRAEQDPHFRRALWALAFAYHRAGRFEKSHWVTRWQLLDYRHYWPVGGWRDYWRVAYPLAFLELFEKHASELGYPVELHLAIAREESAFNPELESWAHAIGLSQLIIPTARRFAAGTGYRVNRRTLRKPEVNVAIAARFLDYLYELFGGQVAIAIPAYNAGEGRLKGWLRNSGHEPQDLFAENMSIDQARGYSKRVLASFFAYRYLADGAVPAIPTTLDLGSVQ